jgi:hypothetical protein
VRNLLGGTDIAYNEVWGVELEFTQDTGGRPQPIIIFNSQSLSWTEQLFGAGSLSADIARRMHTGPIGQPADSHVEIIVRANWGVWDVSKVTLLGEGGVELGSIVFTGAGITGSWGNFTTVPRVCAYFDGHGDLDPATCFAPAQKCPGCEFIKSPSAQRVHILVPIDDTEHECEIPDCDYVADHVFDSTTNQCICGAFDPSLGSVTFTWAQIFDMFFESPGAGNAHGSMPVDITGGINVSGRTASHQGLGINIAALRALNTTDSTIVLTGTIIGGDGGTWGPNFNILANGNFPEVISGDSTKITIEKDFVLVAGTSYRLIANAPSNATGFRITGITVGGESIVRSGQGSGPSRWAEVREKFFAAGGNHGSLTVTSAVDGISIRGRTNNWDGIGVNIAELRALNASDSTIVITGAITGGVDPRFQLWPAGSSAGEINGNATSITIPPAASASFNVGTTHRLIVNVGEAQFRITDITVGGVSVFTLLVNPIRCTLAAGHASLTPATCNAPAEKCRECDTTNGPADQLVHDFESISATQHRCRLCNLTANHVFGENNLCTYCNAVYLGANAGGGPVTFSWSQILNMFFEQGGAHGTVAVSAAAGGITVSGRTQNHQGLGINIAALRSLSDTNKEIVIRGTITGGRDGWGPRFEIWAGGDHTRGIYQNSDTSVTVAANNTSVNASGTAHRLIINSGQVASAFTITDIFVGGISIASGLAGGGGGTAAPTACPMCGVVGNWSWAFNEGSHWAHNCACPYNAPHVFDASGRCICGATGTPTVVEEIEAPQDSFREEDFIDSEELIADLLAMIEAGEVPTIDLTNAGNVTIIAADVFQAIAEMGVDVVVVLPTGFSFTIIASSISDSVGAFDLNIAVIVEHTIAQHTTSGGGLVDVSANSLVFKPNFHGNFGFDLVFNITAEQLDYAGIDGETAMHFHICAEGSVTEQDQPRYNADGSIDITLSHASFHILSNEVPLAVDMSIPEVIPGVTEPGGTEVTTPGGEQGGGAVIPPIQDIIEQGGGIWLWIAISAAIILAAAGATVVMLKRRNTGRRA